MPDEYGGDGWKHRLPILQLQRPCSRNAGYHNQCDYCRTDAIKDAYHHLVVLEMSEGHGYQHHDDKRGEDCGKCTHQAAFYFMQLVADEYGYIDSKVTTKK